MDKNNSHNRQSSDRKNTEQTGSEKPSAKTEGSEEGSRIRKRSKSCDCRKSRRRKRVLSRNPFIIFYLELYFNSPEKPVTDVAREAGKKWWALSKEDRRRYERLARKAQKALRRGRRRRKKE